MNEFKKCIFCDNDANYIPLGPLNTKYEVKCPNCEVFAISDVFADQDEDIVKSYTPYKHLISGLIREKNEMGLRLETFTNENIMNITHDALMPKTIMQKLDKILLYFSRRSEMFGSILSLDETIPYSAGYAVNNDELLNMVSVLIEKGYFIDEISIDGKRRLSISFEGLKRAEELLSTNLQTNKVFVAMGFKEDLLEAHREAIQPACKECGLDAFLVIEKEHNDDITDKIVSEIRTSKFVITDFTYNNHGAYFEAGYAQGMGLQVIRICKKEWFNGVDSTGEKNSLHFDINHYNFILWENHEDLKVKLINRIKATII